MIIRIIDNILIGYRLMQAAFDNAVEYVHDRQQFGRPVGTFQLMQGLFISTRAMTSE